MRFCQVGHSIVEAGVEIQVGSHIIQTSGSGERVVNAFKRAGRPATMQHNHARVVAWPAVEILFQQAAFLSSALSPGALNLIQHAVPCFGDVHSTPNWIKM